VPAKLQEHATFGWRDHPPHANFRALFGDTSDESTTTPGNSALNPSRPRLRANDRRTTDDTASI